MNSRERVIRAVESREPDWPSVMHWTMPGGYAVAIQDTRGRTFHHLPLRHIPMLGHRELVPFLAEAIAHPTPDERLPPLNCCHESITVPALHIGGWCDSFIVNTSRGFAGVRQKEARTRSCWSARGSTGSLPRGQVNWTSDGGLGSFSTRPRSSGCAGSATG